MATAARWLAAVALLLVLAGCGGGGGLVPGGRAGGAGGPGVSTIPVQITTSSRAPRGAVEASRAAVAGAVSVRMRALDPTSRTDLIPPVSVSIPTVGSTLTVTLQDVPVGPVLIVVELLNGNGGVLASDSFQLTAHEGVNDVVSLTPAPPPVPRFALVGGQGGGPLTALAFGNAAIPPTRVGTAPLEDSACQGIAVTPDRKRVYAVMSSGKIFGFAVDGTQGTLTPLSGFPMTAASAPRLNAVVEHTGSNLYCGGGDNSLLGFHIEADGALTPLANPLAGPAATVPQLVVDNPRVGVVYVGTDSGGNSAVYAFQVGLGGSLTPLGTAFDLTGKAIAALAVTPDGRHLYGACSDSSAVSLIDLGDDGALLASGVAAGAGATPSGLAIEPGGRFAYVSDRSDDLVRVFRIEADGTWTFLASSTTDPAPGPHPARAPGGQALMGIAVAPDGTRLLGVHNSGSQDAVFFDIGPTTGLLQALPAVAVGGNPSVVLTY